MGKFYWENAARRLERFSQINNRICKNKTQTIKYLIIYVLHSKLGFQPAKFKERV
jgi:hypothetical protein